MESRKKGDKLGNLLALESGANILLLLVVVVVMLVMLVVMAIFFLRIKLVNCLPLVTHYFALNSKDGEQQQQSFDCWTNATFLV